MGRRRGVERADYYRQEASTCARAALTSAVADIRQAYLELEQGWLSLAPKSKENPDDLGVAESGGDSGAPQPVSDRVVDDTNHHRDNAGRKLAAEAFGSKQTCNQRSPPSRRDSSAYDARPTTPHLRRPGHNGRADAARNS